MQARDNFESEFDQFGGMPYSQPQDMTDMAAPRYTVPTKAWSDALSPYNQSAIKEETGGRKVYKAAVGAVKDTFKKV